jgi:WD40 repeat protein
MFSSQSTEVSLNAPCRALAAVRADKVENRFIVGSCSVQQPNHLHVVRFHSEDNELGVDATIPHETGPVNVICTDPADASMVFTAAEESSSAVLWKIPRTIMEQSEGLQYDPEEDDVIDAVSSVTMEQVLSLDHEGGSSLVDIVWRDTSYEESTASSGDILTLDRTGKLTQWDISEGSAAAVRSVEGPGNQNRASAPPQVAWDPHANGDALAVTRGTSVHILDWRVDTSIPSGTVESFQCHRYGITDLDYNPNKPYVLATSGQDGLLKFWDLRMAKHPLLVARGGHSHWAWHVKYNPFHDQLVLSSGTDSMVNLWRVSTISSAPLLAFADDGNDENMSETSAPNVRVGRYDHGEAVYGASWSAADAWVYMTLGYDGKAVLNHVPSKEKYKILL